MSIQYIPDDIQPITDREDSSSGPQPEVAPPQTKSPVSAYRHSSYHHRQHRHRNRGYKTRKARETFAGRWPFGIGLSEVVTGFIISILGIVEFFVIPVLDDQENLTLGFSHENCYGLGLWTGPLLIITGCLAIRASISKRASTIYNWFWLSSVTVFLYACGIGLLIYGYSSNWTPIEQSKSLYTVHTLMSVTIFIGLLLAVVCFFNYYDDVFFGELQLFKKLVKCCMPCCCVGVSLKRTTTDHRPRTMPPINETLIPAPPCDTDPASYRT
ncbi:uncharacterized protein LOC141909876 isoform X2 [Tubulanus polymorphus]|uniref:uncharacterized protein LOC141909876 isoform X2 n=1 Tax=Tubulanus polymorphus TaxID=672921 RepID=UPI003DA67FC4